MALEQIGAPAKPAVGALVTLLKDPEETVRRQAVKALAAIHPGPDVMIPLFSQLMNGTDAQLEAQVLSALTDAGPAAVPGLIKALDNEQVNYWACIVLRGMGPAAADAVPALAGKLKDKRPEIRREAALALGAMQQKAAAVAPQLGAILDDPDAQVAATYALAEIGQVSAADESKIKANVKSGDKFLSSVSAWALARLHPDDKALNRDAAERLVAQLLDKDPNSRALAAQALATLRPAADIMLPIWEKARQERRRNDNPPRARCFGTDGGGHGAALGRLLEIRAHASPSDLYSGADWCAGGHSQ